METDQQPVDSEVPTPGRNGGTALDEDILAASRIVNSVSTNWYWRTTGAYRSSSQAIRT